MTHNMNEHERDALLGKLIDASIPVLLFLEAQLEEVEEARHGGESTVSAVLGQWTKALREALLGAGADIPEEGKGDE